MLHDTIPESNALMTSKPSALPLLCSTTEGSVKLGGPTWGMTRTRTCLGTHTINRVRMPPRAWTIYVAASIWSTLSPTNKKLTLGCRPAGVELRWSDDMVRATGLFPDSKSCFLSNSQLF